MPSGTRSTRACVTTDRVSTRDQPARELRTTECTRLTQSDRQRCPEYGTMPTEIRATTAVLFSERSRLRAIEEARRVGATYQFTNARGQLPQWLKGEHAYLAPYAVRAFLDRCNVKHDLVAEEELCADLAAYQLIFVPNAAALADETIRAIETWLDRPGRFLVVTGKTNLPASL